MTIDYAALKKQTLLDEDTLRHHHGLTLRLARAIAWDTCHKTLHRIRWKMNK
jgi:hypothetical protein